MWVGTVVCSFGKIYTGYTSFFAVCIMPILSNSRVRIVWCEADFDNRVTGIKLHVLNSRLDFDHSRARMTLLNILLYFQGLQQRNSLNQAPK